MATGDKQQPISAKKMALRDLPNETRNTMLKSSGNSALQKERTPVIDALRVSSSPKQQPSCHASPARPQSLGNNGKNGHLVYVRRKLETDLGKINNNSSDSRKHETESEQINNNNSDSPAVKKSRNDCTSELKQKSDLTQDAIASTLQVPTNMPTASLNISSAGSTPPSRSSEKAIIKGLPVPASISSTTTPGFPVYPEPRRVPAAVPVQAETQTVLTNIPSQSEPQRRPRDQRWKERFGQLQVFLKACDQSNQDDYIQKLRSLSSAGRSKHAYELERRAIQLTLEEGKELHRVRILNVLGKAWPDRHASMPAQIRSPMEVVLEEQ